MCRGDVRYEKDVPNKMEQQLTKKSQENAVEKRKGVTMKYKQRSRI